MWGAIAAAAVGAASTYLGNKSQKKAAKSAANAQKEATLAGIESQERMYNQARDDYAPYRAIGSNATGLYKGLSTGEDINTRNALSNYASYRGSTLPSANIAGPRMPGANISMDQSKYMVDPSSAYVDPTHYGGEEELNALKSFKMSADDPVYRWKMEQAKKMSLAGLSAGGLTGSKYGIGVMQDAGMKVAADEYDSQYGRAMNLYNAGYQQKSDNYSRMTDQKSNDWQRRFTQNDSLYNREYGVKSDNYTRGAQNALTAYNAASDNYNRSFQNAQYTDNREMGRLSSIYNMSSDIYNNRYNRALDAVKIGAGAAGTSGGWAMQNGGNAAQMYANQGAANAAAATEIGNANAQMWAGIGNAPANALSMYYANK